MVERGAHSRNAYDGPSPRGRRHDDGVGATDPLTFIGSTLLFFVVGAAACYVPARRATAIGAMDALRYD